MGTQMEALECIMTRRSVRKYSAKSLSEGTLETLIRAGQQAPSAHNTQPWLFLSLTERETLHRLVPMTPWWGLLDQCAAAVVVCADERILEEKSMLPEFQTLSCAAALENMLLAAHSMGLGGVWLGMCRGQETYDSFKEVLGIPSWARVIGMAAFGYPSEMPEPTDRMCSGKWFKERWGE